MTDHVADSLLNRDWSGVPIDERMRYVHLAFNDPEAIGLPPCQTWSHAGTRTPKETPMLKLTCPVIVEPPVPASGLGIGAVRRAVLCGQPAVVVILTETDHGACCCGDHFEHEVHAWPACADHAPEEVHEARSSMAEEEFLVLSLPEPELANSVIYRVIVTPTEFFYAVASEGQVTTHETAKRARREAGNLPVTPISLQAFDVACRDVAIFGHRSGDR